MNNQFQVGNIVLLKTDNEEFIISKVFDDSTVELLYWSRIKGEICIFEKINTRLLVKRKP
jgi:hypothetical protein